MKPRIAVTADSGAIAAIYNEGIEDRTATFETDLRAEADVEQWFDADMPIVAVESDGDVVAFAAAGPYRPERRAYDGVRGFAVYVARSHRGRGAGRAAMTALIEECERLGYLKLVSRIFPENT